MEKPKVSVCIVTYNHEKFIEQCLDSLVNQNTNFHFEILISDDCSKDSTRKILTKYQELYPDIIFPFFQPKNLGAKDNFIFVHQKAQGEYVVHIDGDDYALPGKLQTQANYLDQHEDCNIVWHRMHTVKDGVFFDDNYDTLGVVDKKIDILDLISNITIGLNSSKMYRANFVNKNWFAYYDLDYSYNVLKLMGANKYAAFTGGTILGVYRSSIGISITHNYEIKVRIYKCLLLFYKDKIVDRSIINAKILLLLLSDLKHLEKTTFYGIYAFLLTMFNFRFRTLKIVHSKKMALVNMAKISSYKG